MFVRLWMTRDPITVSPDTTLPEAREKMDRGAFRHLPVVEGGRLVGLISDDEARAGESHGSGTRVEDSMARDPVHVDPYLPLEQAVLLLRRGNSDCLPVVHKEKLVGILTESDVFDAFSQIMAAEVESVRVTFDGPEGNRMLRKAVVLCERFDIEVLSFVSHVRGIDADKRIFAVRGLGGRVEEYVEALWKEGFRVLQTLIPGPKASATDSADARPVEASFVIEGPKTGEALSWLGRKIDDLGLELHSLTTRPHGEKADRAHIALRVKGTWLQRFERALAEGGFEVLQVKALATASAS